MASLSRLHHVRMSDPEPSDGAMAALLPHDARLTALPGVGPTTSKRLHDAGIARVFDLVTFFPRRYRPLRALAAPDEAAIDVHTPADPIAVEVVGIGALLDLRLAELDDVDVEIGRAHV